MNKILKIISWVVLLTFGSQDLLRAMPEERVLRPEVSGLSGESIPFEMLGIRIPHEYAVLSGVHEGSNGRLIIHIQDAHANLSGQKNLAGALDAMMSAHGISTVLVEGGSGDVGLDEVREIAPAEVWERVARRFLHESKIAGEEYLNLTTTRQMRIRGIEDPELYVEALDYYAELVQKRGRILDDLRKAGRAVDRLKNRFYPRALLGYEEKERAVLSNGNPAIAGSPALSGLYESLLSMAAREKIVFDDLPSVAGFRELIDIESGLDFPKINGEYAALLEALGRTLGQDGLRARLSQWKKSENTWLGRSMLLRELLESAQVAGVEVRFYPELLKYAGYLGSMSRLDLHGLTEEFEVLEERVYRRMLEGADVLKLRAVDRYVELLRKACHIRLSSREVAAVRLNEPDFPQESWLGFLNRKLVECGFVEEAAAYSELLEEAVRDLHRFYGNVRQRDEAFVRNTKEILDASGEDRAFLIAGGHHTERLTALLREEGFSYLVLTPAVTDRTDHGRYEEILLSSRPSGEGGRPGGASVWTVRAFAAADTGFDEDSRLFELVTAASRMAGKEPEAVVKGLKDKMGPRRMGRRMFLKAGAAAVAAAQLPAVSAFAASRSRGLSAFDFQGAAWDHLDANERSWVRFFMRRLRDENPEDLLYIRRLFDQADGGPEVVKASHLDYVMKLFFLAVLSFPSAEVHGYWDRFKRLFDAGYVQDPGNMRRGRFLGGPFMRHPVWNGLAAWVHKSTLRSQFRMGEAFYPWARRLVFEALEKDAYTNLTVAGIVGIDNAVNIELLGYEWIPGATVMNARGNVTFRVSPGLEENLTALTGSEHGHWVARAVLDPRAAVEGDAFRRLLEERRMSTRFADVLTVYEIYPAARSVIGADAAGQAAAFTAALGRTANAEERDLLLLYLFDEIVRSDLAGEERKLSDEVQGQVFDHLIDGAKINEITSLLSWASEETIGRFLARLEHKLKEEGEIHRRLVGFFWKIPAISDWSRFQSDSGYRFSEDYFDRKKITRVYEGILASGEFSQIRDGFLPAALQVVGAPEKEGSGLDVAVYLELWAGLTRRPLDGREDLLFRMQTLDLADLAMKEALRHGDVETAVRMKDLIETGVAFAEEAVSRVSPLYQGGVPDKEGASRYSAFVLDLIDFTSKISAKLPESAALNDYRLLHGRCLDLLRNLYLSGESGHDARYSVLWTLTMHIRGFGDDIPPAFYGAVDRTVGILLPATKEQIAPLAGAAPGYLHDYFLFYGQVLTWHLGRYAPERDAVRPDPSVTISAGLHLARLTIGLADQSYVEPASGLLGRLLALRNAEGEHLVAGADRETILREIGRFGGTVPVSLGGGARLAEASILMPLVTGSAVTLAYLLFRRAAVLDERDGALRHVNKALAVLESLPPEWSSRENQPVRENLSRDLREIAELLRPLEDETFLKTLFIDFDEEFDRRMKIAADRLQMWMRRLLKRRRKGLYEMKPAYLTLLGFNSIRDAIPSPVLLFGFIPFLNLFRPLGWLFGTPKHEKFVQRLVWARGGLRDYIVDAVEDGGRLAEPAAEEPESIGDETVRRLIEGRIRKLAADGVLETAPEVRMNELRIDYGKGGYWKIYGVGREGFPFVYKIRRSGARYESLRHRIARGYYQASDRTVPRSHADLGGFLNEGEDPDYPLIGTMRALGPEDIEGPWVEGVELIEQERGIDLLKIMKRALETGNRSRRSHRRLAWHGMISVIERILAKGHLFCDGQLKNIMLVRRKNPPVLTPVGLDLDEVVLAKYLDGTARFRHSHEVLSKNLLIHFAYFFISLFVKLESPVYAELEKGSTAPRREARLRQKLEIIGKIRKEFIGYAREHGFRLEAVLDLLENERWPEIVRALEEKRRHDDLLSRHLLEELAALGMDEERFFAPLRRQIRAVRENGPAILQEHRSDPYQPSGRMIHREEPRERQGTGAEGARLSAGESVWESHAGHLARTFEIPKEISQDVSPEEISWQREVHERLVRLAAETASIWKAWEIRPNEGALGRAGLKPVQEKIERLFCEAREILGILEAVELFAGEDGTGEAVIRGVSLTVGGIARSKKFLDEWIGDLKTAKEEVRKTMRTGVYAAPFGRVRALLYEAQPEWSDKLTALLRSVMDGDLFAALLELADPFDRKGANAQKKRFGVRSVGRETRNEVIGLLGRLCEAGSDLSWEGVPGSRSDLAVRAAGLFSEMLRSRENIMPVYRNAVFEALKRMGPGASPAAAAVTELLPKTRTAIAKDRGYLYEVAEVLAAVLPGAGDAEKEGLGRLIYFSDFLDAKFRRLPVAHSPEDILKLIAALDALEPAPAGHLSVHYEFARSSLRVLLIRSFANAYRTSGLKRAVPPLLRPALKEQWLAAARFVVQENHQGLIRGSKATDLSGEEYGRIDGFIQAYRIDRSVAAPLMELLTWEPEAEGARAAAQQPGMEPFLSETWPEIRFMGPQGMTDQDRGLVARVFLRAAGLTDRQRRPLVIAAPGGLMSLDVQEERVVFLAGARQSELLKIGEFRPSEEDLARAKKDLIGVKTARIAVPAEAVRNAVSEEAYREEQKLIRILEVFFGRKAVRETMARSGVLLKIHLDNYEIAEDEEVTQYFAENLRMIRSAVEMIRERYGAGIAVDFGHSSAHLVRYALESGFDTGVAVEGVGVFVLADADSVLKDYRGEFGPQKRSGYLTLQQAMMHGEEVPYLPVRATVMAAVALAVAEEDIQSDDPVFQVLRTLSGRPAEGFNTAYVNAIRRGEIADGSIITKAKVFAIGAVKRLSVEEFVAAVRLAVRLVGRAA